MIMNFLLMSLPPSSLQVQSPGHFESNVAGRLLEQQAAACQKGNLKSFTSRAILFHACRLHDSFSHPFW